MPVYEYRAVADQKGCPHCQESFELFQRMSDEPVKTCPECGGNVERIITSCNVVRAFAIRNPLTTERLRKAGMKKLVKDDDGRYVDVTKE